MGNFLEMFLGLSIESISHFVHSVTWICPMAARNILLWNSEKCCNFMLLHLLFNHGIVLTIL